MASVKTLINSLKRLYDKKSPACTIEKLKSMVAEGKIDEEDFEYITGEEFSE